MIALMPFRLCLMSLTAVAALALGPAGASFPAAAQSKDAKPADPLVTLNNLFRSEYAAARKAVLAKSEPIIVVQFDQLVLFDKGTRKVETFTPAIYHEVKALAHAPLTMYVVLARHTGTTLGDATVEALRDFKARLVAAEKSFAGRPRWTEAVLANNRKIVDASVALIDEAIEGRKIDAATLQAYTRRMRPLVLANADVAAAAQLDGLHALVGKWRRELGEETWRKTYIIVMAPRQARPGSLQYAYFERYLGGNAEGRRLFYAENVFDADAAARLLGTILLDRGASVAFFANRHRLERDLLADAAAIHVRKLLPAPKPAAPKQAPAGKK